LPDGVNEKAPLQILINQAYQGDTVIAEAESYDEPIRIKYGIELIGQGDG